MKVLISPGYGAGWSTWSQHQEIATDEALIKLFEEGCTEEEMSQACINRGYEEDGTGPYMGGFSNLEVVEIPKGCRFRITEYDGWESVEILDSSSWDIAEE